MDFTQLLRFFYKTSQRHLELLYTWPKLFCISFKTIISRYIWDNIFLSVFRTVKLEGRAAQGRLSRWNKVGHHDCLWMKGKGGLSQFEQNCFIWTVFISALWMLIQCKRHPQKLHRNLCTQILLWSHYPLKATPISITEESKLIPWEVTDPLKSANENKRCAFAAHLLLPSKFRQSLVFSSLPWDRKK